MNTLRVQAQRVMGALAVGMVSVMAFAESTPVFTSDGSELAAASGAVTALLAVGGAIFVGYAIYHISRRGVKTAQRS